MNALQIMGPDGYPITPTFVGPLGLGDSSDAFGEPFSRWYKPAPVHVQAWSDMPSPIVRKARPIREDNSQLSLPFEVTA